MDSSNGGEHTEAASGVNVKATGDKSDHPAIERIVDRMQEATNADRERLAAHLEAADDGDTQEQEGKNRDRTTPSGD